MEKLKKYSAFAIILILLLCVLWLAPAYKRVTEELTKKDTTIADLKKQIETWKNKKTVRRTFDASGRLRSETSSEILSGSRTTEDSHSTHTSLESKKKETVTKRGLLNVNAYWDIGNLSPQPKAYSASYQIGLIGPSAFVQPDPFVGFLGIGVYF